MSSDSESNSFANFWTSSDEDIMEGDEDDVQESFNTQTQLCALVKLTIFELFSCKKNTS